MCVYIFHPAPSPWPNHSNRWLLFDPPNGSAVDWELNSAVKHVTSDWIISPPLWQSQRRITARVASTDFCSTSPHAGNLSLFSGKFELSCHLWNLAGFIHRPSYYTIAAVPLQIIISAWRHLNPYNSMFFALLYQRQDEDRLDWVEYSTKIGASYLNQGYWGVGLHRNSPGQKSSKSGQHLWHFNSGCVLQLFCLVIRLKKTGILFESLQIVPYLQNQK